MLFHGGCCQPLLTSSCVYHCMCVFIFDYTNQATPWSAAHLSCTLGHRGLLPITVDRCRLRHPNATPFLLHVMVAMSNLLLASKCCFPAFAIWDPLYITDLGSMAADSWQLLLTRAASVMLVLSSSVHFLLKEVSSELSQRI